MSHVPHYENNYLSSFFFPRHKNTIVFLQKNQELRCMWDLSCLLGPLFTGLSEHSDVWACMEAPHGLAGKNPPTGSSQWTVFDHHQDCKTTLLHRPPTMKHTHRHIQIHVEMNDTQKTGHLVQMSLNISDNFSEINEKRAKILCTMQKL